MRLIFFKALLLLFCISFAEKATAQSVYDSFALRMTTTINNFLALSPTDRIADIGTGSGSSIIPIAEADTAILFTLEDLSPKYCNPKKISRTIRLFKSRAKSGQFSYAYGNDTSTNLPAATFDKVLAFDVLHEFTYRQKMLDNIKRIMKPGASLFVGEILTHKKEKKQRKCNFPFLNDTELKETMKENNFVLLREEITYDEDKNRYRKIFEYKAK